MSKLRMSDVFELPMSVDGHSVESAPHTPIGAPFEVVSDITCDSGKDAEYVAHAINNHDTMQDTITQLEADQAELLEFIQSLASAKVYSVEVFSPYGGENNMDCLCDSWKEKATDIINKHKSI